MAHIQNKSEGIYSEVSACQDSLDELFKVKAVFFFHFELFEKLIQFIICQLLSKVSHHVSKLLDCYCRTLRLKNGLHGFNQLILSFGLFVLTSYQFSYFAISAKKSENSNLPLPSLSTILVHSVSSD